MLLAVIFGHSRKIEDIREEGGFCPRIVAIQLSMEIETAVDFSATRTTTLLETILFSIYLKKKKVFLFSTKNIYHKSQGR